ncbi:actin family protein [Streptomyces sp. NBC_00237]|uniref:hypothetical protein n=1 Tax=Streptomyces sp. NBC_00237 TaxID=2975687 RepID=UPI002250A23E|nr:hypothetical protein [Streptomyces sp. NBC_00237]MCX5200616.1 actin family protein [Streptomyces sp. NBC_00237]
MNGPSATPTKIKYWRLFGLPRRFPSVGRDAALVVDVGDSLTSVTGFRDGEILKKTIV